MTINHRIARVVNAVAAHAGLEPAEILSKDRHQTVALARQIAVYVCRNHLVPRPSFPELGRAFGKDHTTIMAAVRSVELKRAKDRWVEETITIARDVLSIHESDELSSPLDAVRELNATRDAIAGELRRCLAEVEGSRAVGAAE